MSDTVMAATEVTITIDGREVKAAPGDLIIEAAEASGVFIPRFCYHPRLKPVGMCRMCLVEVSGPRGPSLQPACFISVAEGQEIQTSSPAARKAQEGVLEFLLVNHPLDCPVCDKGGECPLQDQAMSHGPGESRFIEEKRHFAKPITLGPLTLLDRERCIQCARCTRFAEEIAGEPLIDFYGRGDEIEVAVFPDAPFTSYFSGNTVQICPVGALTSVPYRFVSRPWDLEQVESTCTLCAVGCRIAVQSSAGRVVRFLGIDSAPVNQSWLCDRGRYGFGAIHSPERLTEPLMRKEGEDALAAVSWSHALAETAAGIRQSLAAEGPGSIGVIGGARLSNEDQFAWSKLARAVIGTDNVDAQLGDGLAAELVASLPPATIDEACRAKVVVLLAGDLHEELPVLHLRLRKAAVHDGLKIIDCSPVPTELAKVAAAVVPARPGEAASLMRALLPGTEAGLEVPGVSAAQITAARELLSGLSGSDVVLVLGRTSVAEQGEAAAGAAAVMVEGFAGLRVLVALRRSNVRGAIDMGLAPGMLPGRVTLDGGREWFESQWGSLPASPGLDTRAMLEAAAAGLLRTLVLLGADPLSDFPDRALAARALEAVSFLVAVDTLPSASAQLADVLLPAAGLGERLGTTTNIEGRVTRLAQKVVPPGLARPDWVIAVELAQHLGFDLGFENVEGIWEEIEEVAPSHHGATVEAVYGPGGRDGIVLPVAAVGLGRPARPARLDPVATPGIDSVITQGAPLLAGAAALGSSEMAVSDGTKAHRGAPADETAPPRELPTESVRLRNGVARPAPAVFDPARWPVPPAPTPDSYSLRLVTRRSLYDQGSLVQATESLAGLVGAVQLHMRPKDLEQLGVAAGGRVRVRSARGELVVAVSSDELVPTGVAMLGLNLSAVDEPGASTLIDSDEPVQLVRVETVAD
ncbi:MAG: NADH-quinone oxidoreductase subunit NuoG [Acidimicrobiales bacterium]